VRQHRLGVSQRDGVPLGQRPPIKSGRAQLLEHFAQVPELRIPMERCDDRERGAQVQGSDMHASLRLVAFCVAAALAGCSIAPIIFTGVEDCEVAGDEDGNGQADCADPACAAAAACRSVCGDGVPGGPEQCDDGNLVTETACPYGTASCTLCNATCSAPLALAGNACGDDDPGGPSCATTAPS
jgi:cysteine-rich repeat protein